MRQFKQFIYRFFPPVLWMGVIFFISSQATLPGPQTESIVWWDFLLKKTAHVIVYAILFYLWQRAFSWRRKATYSVYIWAFIITFIYAVSDEYHQSLVPGRKSRLYDVGFDMLGAGLMYLKIRKWI